MTKKTTAKKTISKKTVDKKQTVKKDENQILKDAILQMEREKDILELEKNAYKCLSDMYFERLESALKETSNYKKYLAISVIVNIIMAVFHAI